MKRFFLTERSDRAALIARLTLGLVVFPHGAQKMFGWFGGSGFSITMSNFTSHMNLPWIIAFLVIVIESIGAICIVLGLATRFWAIAMFINFMGIILTSHIKYGFFMNWNMLPDAHEGFEFHLLIIGLCIILIVVGGGKWSLDGAMHRHPATTATSSERLAM